MTADLTRLISRHVDQQVVCDRWCSCGVQHPLGYAAHLAEVIADRFLVVPRTEVRYTEYAVKYPGAPEPLWAMTDKRPAVERAADGSCTAVMRPVLAWSPVPLGDVPDGS